MKPRKYTPSKRVRSHIAKWEASDFAGLNAAFGGDAVGAKAIELMNMLGSRADSFTDDELDGLLSTYYNLSPKGFRKTLMPYIDAYAADLSDATRMRLDQAMRNRWTIAALKYQKGIKRRAAADADLMGLKYNQPIIEQPDAVRVKPVIPEENTRATWSGAEDVSPYVTGRPMLNIRPRILLPTIEEVLEDSAWQPPFPRLKPAYKNGRLPGFKDGTRYIPDGNGGWDRITDDEMADAFANLVITPNNSYEEKTVNRPGPYDSMLRQKIHNTGYVTDEMIAQDNRIRYLNQLRGRGELPLEQVSPEFDLLTIGASTPFRTGKTLRQLRALNKEMDAVFAEGLKHGSKDMPWIYDAEQVINPLHFRSASASGAKQIGQKEAVQGASLNTVVLPVLAIDSKQPLLLPLKQRYIFKSPEYPDEPFDPTIDLDQGLHDIGISPRNEVPLIRKTSNNPAALMNASKLGIKLIEPYRWRYVPDPPEATYEGKPATKVIQPYELAHELFGDPIDFKAVVNRPRQLALPEPRYSKYVDSEGNVNVRNVVQAIREFYKKHPEARNYKNIINSSGTLDQHIAAVVKSAQEAPLPEGYTRLQLVLSALFHDIGKTLDPTKTHDKKSVEILKELGIEVSPEVENAIGRHMSSHLGNKDALSKALHFVDVARGQDMSTAMEDFNYLGYPGMNKLQVKPLYKNDTRWLLLNIINPILDEYGYGFTDAEYAKYGIRHVKGDPTIPLDSSPEVARLMVLDKVKLHRSFVRSLYKANGHDWENLRKQTALQLGKDTKDVTNEEMFRNAALYIKNRSTNSGTMGLDDYLRKYELNPKDYLALYASSRDATASGYRTGSNGTDGESYVVQMNINDNPNWSLAELWANNEFPIVHSSYGNPRHGTLWRTYELPFRLNTGLDLSKELKKNNDAATNYNNAEEARAAAEATTATDKYFYEHPEELDTGLTYFKDTTPTSWIQAQYKRVKGGVLPGQIDKTIDPIQYWDTTGKYIVNQDGTRSSASFALSRAYTEGINNGYVPMVDTFTPSAIEGVNKTLRDAGLSEVYPLMSSDVSTRNLNVKYPRAYNTFKQMINSINRVHSVIDDLKTSNAKKIDIHDGMLEGISILRRDGIISDKQLNSINKELRRGKDIYEVFDKYASKKQLLLQAKNYYFSNIKLARKKDAFVRREGLQERILEEELAKRNEKYLEFYKLPKLKPVLSNEQLMKLYDVDPDYSYMSPDGYRVFSTERLDHPNKYDEAGNHFVVVGPRGSKQLNIVRKWDPTVNTKSHGHGGNYIPGTSRNLGAIGAAVAAGSTTLSPRKKKNK